MQKFLKFYFWFSSGPMIKLYLIILLIVFCIILSIGFFVKFYMLKNRKNIDGYFRRFLNYIESLCFVMGSLGLLWSFFYYEGAYVLSWRFWLIVWAIIFIIWVIYIFKYYLSIREKRKLISREKHFRKYLP